MTIQQKHGKLTGVFRCSPKNNKTKNKKGAAIIVAPFFILLFIEALIAVKLNSVEALFTESHLIGFNSVDKGTNRGGGLTGKSKMKTHLKNKILKQWSETQ
jgi:hypothetical protein